SLPSHASLMSRRVCGRLDPFGIEVGLHAAAVSLERTLSTGGVGPLKDPVLPGGKPAEDLGLHGLRAGEAQVCLHTRQPIGGKARAFLEENAHLVLPIDVVERTRTSPIRSQSSALSSRAHAALAAST